MTDLEKKNMATAKPPKIRTEERFLKNVCQFKRNTCFRKLAALTFSTRSSSRIAALLRQLKEDVFQLTVKFP